MKIIKLTKENWKDAARKYFFTEEDIEKYSFYYENDVVPIFIAVDGKFHRDKWLGSCSIYDKGGTFKWIDDLYVDEEYRRQGIGKLLVDHALKNGANSIIYLGNKDKHVEIMNKLTSNKFAGSVVYNSSKYETITMNTNITFWDTKELKEIKDYIEQTIEPDYFKSVVTCIPFRIVRNQFAELPF